MISNAETPAGLAGPDGAEIPAGLASSTPQQTAGQDHPIAYAGFLRRLVAFGIDATTIAVMVYLTLIASQAAGMALRGEAPLSGGFALLSFLFFNLFGFVYFVFFHSNGGQTPGKKILGIMVLGQSGGQTSTARAVFRTIGYFVSSIFFMAGFLWALIDAKGQTWHDKLAGTVVVEI